MKKFINNRFFLSFILGLISALAFAPTYLFFLAIISFSGLFLLIDKEKGFKKIFFLGWCFGFGHFLLGLYWISISLLTDIVKFGWLMPFSISLIPACLAIYVGFTCFVSNKIGHYLKFNKLSKIITFSLIWVFFEYLRSILFSGFPWNLIGYSLSFSQELSQIASIFGIYGLSLLAILLYSIPATLIEIDTYNLRLNDNSKRNFAVISILCIFIITIFSLGSYRINKSELKQVENGNIRLVQASIPQDNKWNDKSKYDSFYKHVLLSNLDKNKKINYTIWSESSVPYLLDKKNKELLKVISSAAPKDGYVITGGIRAKFDKNGEMNKVYNSIFVIDDKSKIIDFYDKRHLVPFGEYVPLQKYLPFISKITNGSIGFSSGKGAKTINLKNSLPSFSPLICYEIIFSNLTKEKNSRPDFLLNITNDAWFGRSSGPYQHLAMAKIRAIEYGIPLIRVANNGISAFIDPFGKIIAKIELNEIAIKDIKLVEKLEVTIYDKYDIKLLILLIFFIILLILASNYSNFKKSKKLHETKK